MEKLTNKEEEIMKILWRLKKAFVKEIMEEISAHKPHYNTLSTIVRNLEEKNFVGFTAYDNSYKNLVSFFAKEEKISVEELKEIISLIENNK